MLRFTVAAAVLMFATPAAADDHAPRAAPTSFHLGVTAGKSYVAGHDGEGLGVRAGLRGGALSIALEVDEREHGSELSRTAGGFATLDLLAGRLVPFVGAGAGAGRHETGYGLTIDHVFGQVGTGVRLRVSDTVELTGDLRRARRLEVDRSDEYYILLADDPVDLIYAPFEQDVTEVQLGLLIRL